MDVRRARRLEPWSSQCTVGPWTTLGWTAMNSRASLTVVPSTSYFDDDEPCAPRPDLSISPAPFRESGGTARPDGPVQAGREARPGRPRPDREPDTGARSFRDRRSAPEGNGTRTLTHAPGPRRRRRRRTLPAGRTGLGASRTRAPRRTDR